MQFQTDNERKCGHRKLQVFLDESKCKRILAFPSHKEISNGPTGRREIEFSHMITSPCPAMTAAPKQDLTFFAPLLLLSINHFPFPHQILSNLLGTFLSVCPFLLFFLFMFSPCIFYLKDNNNNTIL